MTKPAFKKIIQARRAALKEKLAAKKAETKGKFKS